MNFSFKIGKVILPSPIGKVEVENIEAKVNDISIVEVAGLVDMLSQFQGETPEPHMESAEDVLNSILGGVKSKLKQQMEQPDSPFGPGFPFGPDSPFNKQSGKESSHPLFGVPVNLGALNIEEMVKGKDISKGISDFFKQMNDKE